MDQLPVHLDVIALRIGFGAQLRDDLSVDRDPALLDQQFRLAPRSQTGGRDNFL